jgi:hypothetical protein
MMLPLLLAAFCTYGPDTDGYQAQMEDTPLLWDVDDLASDWLLYQPILVNDPTNTNLYYLNVVRSIVDKASQDWMRVGRVRTKLGFKSFQTSNFYADDGASRILLRTSGKVCQGTSIACQQNSDCDPDKPCASVCGIGGSSAPAYFGSWTSECDIVVDADCVSRPITTETTQIGQNGSANNFERTLAHEMGPPP